MPQYLAAELLQNQPHTYVICCNKCPIISKLPSLCLLIRYLNLILPSYPYNGTSSPTCGLLVSRQLLYYLHNRIKNDHIMKSRKLCTIVLIIIIFPFIRFNLHNQLYKLIHNNFSRLGCWIAIWDYPLRLISDLALL
jgi:hypothetical protein